MSVVTFFAWINKNIKSALKNPLFVEFVVGKSFKVGMEQFQIFWEIFSPAWPYAHLEILARPELKSSISFKVHSFAKV